MTCFLKLFEFKFRKFGYRIVRFIHFLVNKCFQTLFPPATLPETITPKFQAVSNFIKNSTLHVFANIPHTIRNTCRGVPYLVKLLELTKVIGPPYKNWHSLLLPKVVFGAFFPVVA